MQVIHKKLLALHLGNPGSIDTAFISRGAVELWRLGIFFHLPAESQAAAIEYDFDALGKIPLGQDKKGNLTSPDEIKQMYLWDLIEDYVRKRSYPPALVSRLIQTAYQYIHPPTLAQHPARALLGRLIPLTGLKLNLIQIAEYFLYLISEPNATQHDLDRVFGNLGLPSPIRTSGFDSLATDPPLQHATVPPLHELRRTATPVYKREKVDRAGIDSDWFKIEALLVRLHQTTGFHSRMLGSSKIQTVEAVKRHYEYEEVEWRAVVFQGLEGAWQLLNQWLSDPSFHLDLNAIQLLHAVLFFGRYPDRVGIWRGNHPPGQIYPPPHLIHPLVEHLLQWFHSATGKMHPIELAARFSVSLDAVHPFNNGNGRLNRFLVDWILLSHDIPVPIRGFKTTQDGEKLDVDSQGVPAAAFAKKLTLGVLAHVEELCRQQGIPLGVLEEGGRPDLSYIPPSESLFNGTADDERLFPQKI